MRIVAAADTHLHRSGEAARVVPDGDVFVHAGDFLLRGDLEELARAAEWLRALPHRTKVVVAGNHEICLERQPEIARRMLVDAGVIYLEDDGATIDGVRFWGSPWQPRFRIWAFGAARGAELAAKWAKIPSGLDVLVTHGPPYGFGDRIPWREDLRHVGCLDLAARIRDVRPRVHLFGHIHQDPGEWVAGPTRLYNVTTDEGRRAATVIEL